MYVHTSIAASILLISGRSGLISWQLLASRKLSIPTLGRFKSTVRVNELVSEKLTRNINDT